MAFLLGKGLFRIGFCACEFIISGTLAWGDLTEKALGSPKGDVAFSEVNRVQSVTSVSDNASVARALRFNFPTENQKVLSGDYEGFYMYTNRYKDGVDLKPWSGGAYGLTRNVVVTPTGEITVKFHEGIDIKPLYRDAKNCPEDKVYACAPGVVVHVSKDAHHSNYGRYVVVEHKTSDGPVYTLYAHLASVDCEVGQTVGEFSAEKGQKGCLGVLGYSGAGFNRSPVRAHLHLEMALMVNGNFVDYYAQHTKQPDYHGIYNGLNLIGFNSVHVLMGCAEGKLFSLSHYIKSLPCEYVVRLPGKKKLDLVERYPFMLRQVPGVDANNAVSWELMFTKEGVPIGCRPSLVETKSPEVVWLREDTLNPLYRTNYKVRGSKGRYELTGNGRKAMEIYGFGRD